MSKTRKWPTFVNYRGQRTKPRAGDILVIHPLSIPDGERQVQFFRRREGGIATLSLIEGNASEDKIGWGDLLNSPHALASVLAAMLGLHIKEEMGLDKITGCPISSRHFLLCR